MTLEDTSDETGHPIPAKPFDQKPITDAELAELNDYVAKYVSDEFGVPLTNREYAAIVARLNAERARRERAEALLRPFAREVSDFTATRGADGWDGALEDCPLHLFSRCWNGDKGATVRDCIAAAAHLASTGGTR